MKLFRVLYSQSKLIDKTEHLFQQYAHYQPSPLSLKQFLEFGAKNASEKLSFLFLRKELPVRLANIMKEIDLLPDSLLGTPSVSQVIKWYQTSFNEILDFEDTNPNDEGMRQTFTENLITIRNRHSNVVETMAQGVLEMRDHLRYDHTSENQIQYFLDRFYMSRISIRMLINQHTMLFGSNLPGHPRHVGSIDPHCNALTVAEDACANARFLCDQYYMASPEVEFNCLNPYGDGNKIDFVYVPSHLYHILFELFKNAMRAVVEHHGADSDLPPLTVTICKGKEDLTIKLSDQGGGIPRHHTEMLFNYMYTTAPQPLRADNLNTEIVPLAGLGYGLPISRLYARYLLGDLILNSMEGYGTDAIIYLKVLSSHANELLPIFNSTSSKQYETSIPVADWSNPTYTTGLHSPMDFKSRRAYSARHRHYSTCTSERLHGISHNSLESLDSKHNYTGLLQTICQKMKMKLT